MKIIIETDKGQRFSLTVAVSEKIYALPAKDGIPQVVEGVFDWANHKIRNMHQDIADREQLPIHKEEEWAV